MKVLAFAASNNTQSINQKLALYVAGLVPGVTVETLDLNDFEMPIFSDQREAKFGQPQQAKEFFSKIQQADGLVISFAEHNGNFTAAFKNLYDWTSRIDRHVFQQKPAIFLSTSPGPGGAARVLKTAVSSAQHMGANLIASVSVPNFFEFFVSETPKLHGGPVLQKLTLAAKALSGYVSPKLP